ncbi:MAG: hypothetical protein V1790_09070 [Planctomycetota bacterium]
MNTSAPLEVKVIFDASSRGRRKPTHRVRSSPRISRSSPWIILGIFNLLAGGGLYYTTWWRVDPFIYLTFMLRSPVDVSVFAFTPLAFPIPEPRSDLAVQATREMLRSPPELARNQIMMGATAYGWLTLATAAACALSLSAGAALSRIGGSPWRRAGVVLAATLTLALAAAVFLVWNEYGRKYLPVHLRFGMGGLALWMASIGLALGRAARGLARLAAITLIFSAAGTVVALYLGSQCGAIPPEQSTPLYLALAFLIHSIYGWIQLPILSRLGR